MKTCLTFALLILGIQASAQHKFVKGYFIDNTGIRTECEIRKDWDADVTSPKRLHYRVSPDGNKMEVEIDSTQEFGFENGATYLRVDVPLDRSSDVTVRLTPLRNAEFKIESVVLNRLVRGKASLYEFLDGGLRKYFYRVDDSEISQLVYKRFLAVDKSGPYETSYIGLNEQYKQQLLNDLSCETLNEKLVKELKYEKAPLMNLFERYNRCQAGETMAEIPAPRLNRLRFRAGIAYSEFSEPNPGRTYDPGLAYRFGLEVETILRRDPNWSVPFYIDYEGYSSKSSDDQVSVAYRSVNLGLSVRRYFPRGDDLLFFANGGFVFVLPIGQPIQGYSTTNDLTGSFSLMVGGGVMKGKFSAELYYTHRTHKLKTTASEFAYGGPGLILSYRISN